MPSYYNMGENLNTSELSILKVTPTSPYNKNIVKRNNKKYNKSINIGPNIDQDWQVPQKSNFSDKTESISINKEEIQSTTSYKPYVKDEAQLKKLIKNLDFIKRTIEQHYLTAINDNIKNDEQDESIQAERSNLYF